jgi:hypothetical protein
MSQKIPFLRDFLFKLHPKLPNASNHIPPKPAEGTLMDKLTRHLAASDSFEAIARAWFEAKMHDKY